VTPTHFPVKPVECSFTPRSSSVHFGRSPDPTDDFLCSSEDLRPSTHRPHYTRYSTQPEDVPEQIRVRREIAVDRRRTPPLQGTPDVRLATGPIPSSSGPSEEGSPVAGSGRASGRRAFRGDSRFKERLQAGRSPTSPRRLVVAFPSAAPIIPACSAPRWT
jgi:hypothetical protein